MSTHPKIIKHKVSQACKVIGYSRDTAAALVWRRTIAFFNSNVQRHVFAGAKGSNATSLQARRVESPAP